MLIDYLNMDSEDLDINKKIKELTEQIKELEEKRLQKHLYEQQKKNEEISKEIIKIRIDKLANLLYSEFAQSQKNLFVT